MNRVSSKTASCGPDLVERRRRDGAHLARVPQQRDLLAQPAPQVGVLVGRRVRVVEGVEQPPDPALGDQQRAATRLRGMRGEDRVDLDPREQLPDAGPAAAPREPLDRLADGVVDRPSARPPRTRPQHADALPLLGQVDELEVEGEGAGDRSRLVEVERLDLRGELRALGVRLEVELGRRGAGRSSGAGSARRGRTARARPARR